MATRVDFPIYRVETDHGTGDLSSQPSFVRQIGTTRKLDALTGLVVRDTMDGGRIGTLTAPAGAALCELSDGRTCIELATGEVFDARGATNHALASNRAHSYGLRYSDKIRD